MTRFENFTRNTQATDLTALQGVQPDCGFFTSDIYDPIYHGSVLASEVFPTQSRISQSFSVFSFLRMQPGSNHSSVLPPTGWKTPLEAQRFVSAIQWFITDLFGQQIGHVTLMYRALGHLRGRLESVSFQQAWPDINRRVFSAVIISHIHSLWTTLLQWEEKCSKLFLHYLNGHSVVGIEGASPFVALDHSVSLDSVLSDWMNAVDIRFPPAHITIINCFRDQIPESWNHIFSSPTYDDTSRPVRDEARQFDPDDTRRRQRRGEADRQSSRGWSHNVFMKVEGHADSVRGRNRACYEAIRPIPKVPNDNGELVEICLGASCKGIRCLNQGTCSKVHMICSPQLRQARRDNLRQVREWLRRPAVRERIQLTPVARDYECFR